jgi:hypothetical protein
MIYGISTSWALIIPAFIITVYAARAFFGYRNVARDAQDDYDYKAANNIVPKGVSRDGYINAFKRFHNPRGPLYVALTFGALMLLTPFVMVIIQFLLEQLYLATGRSRVFEPGYLVWQFLIFFMMIASWAGIAYSGAKQFHKRAPGTFSQEIEKARQAEA